MRLEGTPLFDASWVPIVDFGGRSMPLEWRQYIGLGQDIMKSRNGVRKGY